MSPLAFVGFGLNAKAPDYNRMRRGGDIQCTNHPSHHQADRSQFAMTSPWNELASTPRWRGVVSFAHNWIGAFDSDEGMPPDDLDSLLRTKRLKLPRTVREWYVLAANWTHGVMNVWIHPRELAVCDGVVRVLADNGGVNLWGVRVADFQIEDPPVVADAEGGQVVSAAFTQFVAAMVINDVLFDYETEEPLELRRRSACAEGMRLVSSCYGDFIADGPLESATIVMYAYPRRGPVLGKSRTPEGRALLRRLQKR